MCIFHLGCSFTPGCPIQAVNTNSEKQLRKAISIAPRGKRAASGIFDDGAVERRWERWDLGWGRCTRPGYPLVMST